jgi:hypothetical protein
MGKTRFLIGGVVIIAGCGASHPPRVIDMLAGVDGLVVSASIAALRQPEPSATDAGLHIDYPLLFENTGQREIAVDLGAARFRVGAEHGSASCRVGAARPRVLPLRPGDRWRIDCALLLPAQGLKVLLAGDADGLLSIPIHSPTGRGELRFSYALRVGDAT